MSGIVGSVFLARVWEWCGIGTDCPVINDNVPIVLMYNAGSNCKNNIIFLLIAIDNLISYPFIHHSS